MSVRVQVVDWATKPTRKPKNDNEGNISAFANGYPEREEFYVWYFGRTQTGDSIALRVEGFNPYFYVKLPVGWNMQTMNRFIDAVCNKMPERDRQHMLTPEMVWRMDVYGFRNREQERFIHWRFKSDSARQAVRWIINELKDTFDRNLEIYEASIAAELQLSHAIGLVSWVDVPLAKTRLVTSGQSKAKFNYAVPWSHLRSVTGSEGDAVAPLVQMSVDIETFAEDFAGSDPKKPTDVIFQIAATLQTFTSKGEKDTTRHIFALEPCKLSDEPVDFQLYLCATEEALLMNFAKFVEKHDPDIIYSWNGDGFDFRYIFTRAQWLRCLPSFSRHLSRHTNTEFMPCIVREDFNSRAFGSSTFFRLTCPGRLNVDLLFYFRRTVKLESYKLDRVAGHFLKWHKMDMPYKRMWKAWADRDPDVLGQVARYCVRDTILPQMLADTCLVLLGMLELSRICRVPLSYIAHRGEQIKVFSNIIRYALSMGYCIPDNTHGKAQRLAASMLQRQGIAALNDEDDSDDFYVIDDDDSYKGGFVLQPEVGAYFEKIRVYDFQSLYPSIIRAHKLCFTSWVFDDERYGNIPGMEYFEVDVEDESQNRTVRYKFAMHDKTILPRLEDELFETRQRVKRMMKDEKDSFMYSVLDRRQLAVKISMNSIYGFLAAQKLRCKPIGASITAEGRNMILRTKAFIENHIPNSKVIYGDTDSVFVKLPSTIPPDFDSEGLAKEISAIFRAPIKIEYEKQYDPFFIFTKKKYMGIKKAAGEEDKPGKRDSRGDILQRRDSCQLVKDVYDQCCDLLLEKKKLGVSESLRLLRTTLNSLVEGEIDIEKLAISRSLTKDESEYKDSKLPHVEVARLKKKRGELVQASDRISFIIKADRPGFKATPDWSRAEDTEFAKENKVAYDIAHYISAFESPMKALLEIMTPAASVEYIFKNAYNNAYRKAQGNQDIRSIFGAQKATAEQDVKKALAMEATPPSTGTKRTKEEVKDEQDEENKKQKKIDSFWKK